ncbi:hypothetical protein QOT17_021762 [Balamuthia mandrillaris]
MKKRKQTNELVGEDAGSHPSPAANTKKRGARRGKRSVQAAQRRYRQRGHAVEKKCLHQRAEKLSEDLRSTTVALNCQAPELKGSSVVRVKRGRALEGDELLSKDEVLLYSPLTSDFVGVDHEDSSIPFAVFHEPRELGELDEQEVFAALEELSQCMYHLHRHKIKTTGVCFGVGERGGYEKGQSFGHYRMRKDQVCDESLENTLPCQRKDLQETVERLAQVLQSILRSRFPAPTLRRLFCLDWLLEYPPLGCALSFNLYGSKNFASALHFDDDDEEAMAIATWFRDQSQCCLTSHEGEVVMALGSPLNHMPHPPRQHRKDGTPFGLSRSHL